MAGAALDEIIPVATPVDAADVNLADNMVVATRSALSLIPSELGQQLVAAKQEAAGLKGALDKVTAERDALAKKLAEHTPP
eukprot:1757870-Rhodomonas_salina.2